ncbi:MAG: EscU/YscU/HrcU family type III secretion system export apparatus switch protein [Bdellovibrionia bacterium]
MADDKENQSREDLTEEASPHRLEEYRSKGIVSQSKEVTGLLVLLSVGVAMYVMAPRFGSDLAEFMRQVFRTDLSAKADLGSPQIVGQYLMKSLRMMIFVGFPICGVGFVLGVLSSFAQIGVIFTLEPLAPDFKKIDPLQGFQRLMGLKQLMDGGRLLLKVTVILAICAYFLKAIAVNSGRYSNVEPIYLLGELGRNGKVIFLSLVGVLSVFAAADFLLQRQEYQKNLRMTKQEAKQEHKEREGDPQVRARVRLIQREVARRRMMDAVKKADVIVTNPTHIAVALVYDKVSMAAPKVVAKGADLMAQRIKAVALEAGIPLVENVPLARTLYKSVKVGQSVPRALYHAVAEVLSYVYRLKRRT